MGRCSLFAGLLCVHEYTRILAWMLNNGHDACHGCKSMRAAKDVSNKHLVSLVRSLISKKKWAEPGDWARPIAFVLLEFSCMCARRAQSAFHQSTGTGMCILSQFSEFRIQNMHSTFYVYFQTIFRNILPHILMHVSETRLKIHI